MFLSAALATGGTITGVSRYIKKNEGEENPFGRRRTRCQSGDYANAGGAAARARSTQDSGHRRGFCAEEPGTGSDRPRRTGDQRGVRRDGASAHLAKRVSSPGFPAAPLRLRRCAWRSCRNLRAKPLSPCCPIRASATSRQSCSRGLAKRPKPGSACRVGQGSSLSAPLSQHCAPKRIVNSYDNTE